MKIYNPFQILTRFERALWLGSVLTVLVSFLIKPSMGWLSLVASLIGVTALIFTARGEVIGQILIVLFAILYGIISWQQKYYGEMLTYLGMTAPMAALALVSWLSHPFQGKTSEVEVRRMPRREAVLMLLAAVPVTAGFGLLLALFHTANLAERPSRRARGRRRSRRFGRES